jgi:hypothetical protein
MMMEAVQTSETPVNSYQSIQCYNPEDSHLHTHLCESLKSYYEFVTLKMSSMASETTCDKLPTPTPCYTSDYVRIKTQPISCEVPSSAMAVAFNNRILL